jgi:hypothetical protein
VRAERIIPIAALILAAAAPLVAAARLRVARADAFSAEARTYEVAADVQRLLNLRANRTTISAGRKPEQDAFARVEDTIEAIDGTARLTNLAMDSDAAISDAPGYRRQAVSFSLAEMSVPELGRFLDRWRRDQPLWTPIAVSLAHTRSRDVGDRFTVRITVAATYSDRSPEATP